MKRVVIAILIVIFLSSCTAEDVLNVLTHLPIYIASFTVKNEGRFAMDVGVSCEDDQESQVVSVARCVRVVVASGWWG